MRKILVVDDDRKVCEVTAKALSGKYMIHTAFSGKQALEVIQKEKNIDIVLTDVMMPVMSGIDLLMKIRQINNKISVIMISGFYTIDLALEAVNQGAYTYITKPIDINYLELTIESALNQ